jgi:hypothetical protein
LCGIFSSTGGHVVCPQNTPCITYTANGTPTCTASQRLVGASCDDGNLSTYGETCNAAGACNGTPVVCPANTPCTTYTPNGTATCAVSQTPAGGSCNDGNLCTYADTCNAAGTCGGLPVTCHPTDACGIYTCNGTASCTPSYSLPGVRCDDSDGSTTGDACNGSGTYKGISFLHLLPDILYDVAPSQLVITGLPSQVTAGSANTIMVTAYDSKNQLLVGYTGTVTLTSTDPLFVPVSYTFVAADRGQHTFANVQLRRSGTQSVFVRDAAVNVQSPPASTTVTFDSSTLRVSVAGISSPAEAFKLQSVVVSVSDVYGNGDYFGTVQLDSTDPVADLPKDYAFVAADNGTHTFASQLEFRTVGSTNVMAFDRDSGVTGKQSGIVVSAPAAPATCVLQPGGCCTDADCGGVLFGSTCNVAQRLCACSPGYKICRGACIPSSACCDHGDCPQPLHAGSASCDANSCTLHCPAGTSPHDGDCVGACFAPAGDAIQ